MSVSGTGVVFSFAVQHGRSDTYPITGDTFPAAQLAWYKERTLSASGGGQDDLQAAPPKTGGDITPTGLYKQQYFAAGDFDLQPPLEGPLPLLLYGLFGKMTIDDDNPAVGINRYTFEFADDPASLPWMAFRIFTPGYTDAEVADPYGEMMIDAKITNCRITIPAKGLARMTFGYLARDYQIDQSPEAWTYENDYVEDGSIPLSGNGYAKIAGVEYPIVGAVVDINNGTTTPDQEAVVGSLKMHRIAVLQRGATVRLMVKWQRGDFESLVKTGSVDGTEWVPAPFKTETDGSVKALEIELLSTAPVSGSNYNAIRLVADRVNWGKGRPVQYSGAEIIVVEYVGTVVSPAAGQKYFYAELDATSDYSTLPAHPTLTLSATPLAWTEGGGATVIDATAVVSSTTQTHFNGGYVEVSYVSGGTADDVLAVPFAGDWGLAGGTLSYLTHAIGTIPTPKDGTAGKALRVDFTSSYATPAAVQALLRAITFNNGSASPNETDRVLQVALNDGAAGAAVDGWTVEVTATP